MGGCLVDIIVHIEKIMYLFNLYLKTLYVAAFTLIIILFYNAKNYQPTNVICL